MRSDEIYGRIARLVPRTFGIYSPIKCPVYWKLVYNHVLPGSSLNKSETLSALLQGMVLRTRT